MQFSILLRPTILGPLLSGLLLGMAGLGLNPDTVTGQLLTPLAWAGYIPWFLALIYTRPHKAPYHTSATQGLPLKYSLFSGFWVGFIQHALTLHWMLSLHPLTWTGVNSITSLALAIGAWLIWSVLGGLAMALAAVCLSAISTLLGFEPRQSPPKALGWILLVATTLPISHVALSHITDLYIVWVDPVTPIAHHIASRPLFRWVMNYGGALGMWQCMTGLQASLAVCFSSIQYYGLPNISSAPFAKQPAVMWQGCVGASLTGGVLLYLLAPNISPLISPQGPSATTSAHATQWVIVQPNLPIETIRNENGFDTPNPVLAELKASDYPAQSRVLLPEEGAIRGWVRLPIPKKNHDGSISNPDVRQWVQLAQQRQWVLATGAAVLSDSAANNSFLLAPEQGPLQRYNKATLVPFGEIFPDGLTLIQHTPFHGWLARLANHVQFPYVASYTAGNHAAGHALLMPAPSGPWLPTICFELALLAYQTPPKNLHTNATIVNLSNLGWFHGNRALAQQFWDKGKLAALRFNRPVVIAANTGPSGWIDATGRARIQLPLNTPYQQPFVLP